MPFDTPEAPDGLLLKKAFVHNLNRIYFGKCYLSTHINQLIGIASFSALQMAMQEFSDDLKKQIARMDEIYSLISEQPSDKNCNPIKSIVKDKFCLNEAQDLPVLLDIDIISYMQLLEHISITACRMLKMIAARLKMPQVGQLLLECFDESIDNDHLFLLISKEYITLD